MDSAEFVCNASAVRERRLPHRNTNKAMSAIAWIRSTFGLNWTTLRVGWDGLGVFSPWPDTSDAFRPLFSSDELAEYASQRLVSCSDVGESELITRLLSLDFHTERRDVIRDLLLQLSQWSDCDPAIELRKWRLALLVDLLDSVPDDAVGGLSILTEFWLQFGFPADSPHDVQGRGNALGPSEYYQDANYRRLLSRHRAWVKQEMETLTSLTSLTSLIRVNPQEQPVAGETPRAAGLGEAGASPAEKHRP
jgi:hypothetical protein